MEYWYMNGAGNDFVVLDIREEKPELSPLAVELCKLTGADGLMAVEGSSRAELRLHFYNADGSRGEMCGNGARCVCRFAYDKGMAGSPMTIQTDAGIIEGQRLSESRYRVRLNAPGLTDLCRLPAVAYVELGNPGVPHAVVELGSLSWDDREALRSQAVAWRYDPAFPKGCNVNFFQHLGGDTVRILTYERYVEDYTLACGTGSASVAVVLKQQGRLPGNTLKVQNPGGELMVTFAGETPYLEGETQVVSVNKVGNE